LLIAFLSASYLGLCGHCADPLSTISQQPREALLKYAQASNEDPQWTAGVCYSHPAAERDAFGGLGLNVVTCLLTAVF
jgi:hypothetical protein